MKTSTKIIISIVVIAAISGAVYYFFFRKKKAVTMQVALPPQSAPATVDSATSETATVAPAGTTPITPIRRTGMNPPAAPQAGIIRGRSVAVQE